MGVKRKSYTPAYRGRRRPLQLPNLGLELLKPLRVRRRGRACLSGVDRGLLDLARRVVLLRAGARPTTAVVPLRRRLPVHFDPLLRPPPRGRRPGLGRGLLRQPADRERQRPLQGRTRLPQGATAGRRRPGARDRDLWTCSNTLGCTARSTTAPRHRSRPRTTVRTPLRSSRSRRTHPVANPGRFTGTSANRCSSTVSDPSAPSPSTTSGGSEAVTVPGRVTTHPRRLRVNSGTGGGG